MFAKTREGAGGFRAEDKQRRETGRAQLVAAGWLGQTRGEARSSGPSVEGKVNSELHHRISEVRVGD